MNIFIMGAGRIGSAMQYILREKNPVIWDIDSARLMKEVDCDVELQRADVILLCAPTSAHQSLIEKIAQCGSQDVVVVSLAKGMTPDGHVVPDLFEHSLGGRAYGIVCGPMMAEEIMRGKSSFALVASKHDRVRHVMRELFEESSLRIEYSEDVMGVAWLSVIKNVYATLMGVMEALQMGCNMRGYMMTEIAKESISLLEHVGCDSKTWVSAAGIGDLVCTVTSPHSRNRTFGESLVNGIDALPGEGVLAFPYVKERLGSSFEQYPLLVALEVILHDPSRARTVFDELV